MNPTRRFYSLRRFSANLIGTWQRQVRISANPPQPAQADGEMLGTTPIQAHILTQPVQVLVPGQTQASAPPQIP
jgi:diacylglycerol kinase family enzyme